MLKIQFHNDEASGEPAPRFASDAEMALAEQLRHQLEKRYLEPAAEPSPSTTRSGESH